MKKIMRVLPWILLGVCLLFTGLLYIGLSLMKRDAVLQIKNIQAVEEKFQATRTTYDAQVETLKDDLDKAKVALDVYAEELQAAEDSLHCPNKEIFKPDYIHDAGMSKALSEYLTATESGEFKTASPEVLWGGSKTALFTIIMTQNKTEVSHQFIVYHNDAYFKKNRVFSISRQCWLNG